jgi:membrane carboxypeptidase/penicillin-binding protein
MRKQRRGIENRNPWGRFGLTFAGLVSLLSVVLAIGLTIIYTEITRDLPSLEKLPQLVEPPNGVLLQPTRIFDRSEEHILLTLQNPAITDRRYLPIQTSQGPELPTSVLSATIAFVEPNYFSNTGITIYSLFQNKSRTIAQRLVSDLLFWEESRGLRRSLREGMSAVQIIQQFGHEKILEWYLNSAYFGQQAYGIDAAAQVYFGSSATEINLAKAALLASVLIDPSQNPIDTPQIVIERQNLVIEAMLKQGLITENQAKRASRYKIKIREPKLETTNPAPAYTNLVLKQLANTLDTSRLIRGGFKIITSLDYDLQIQANCTVETLIARLNGEFENDENLPFSSCQAARFLPTLPYNDLNIPDNVAANLIVLQPGTGQILAMVGKAKPSLDPSQEPGYPPGTLLTPFVYLTGFTRGFSPGSLVWDIPTDLPLDGPFHGPMRLRVAMANDYLTPAIQMIKQIGLENVWRTARQLGISSLSPLTNTSIENNCVECWFVLNGGQATLLDLVQAYATIANQGMLVGTVSETELTGGLQSIQAITILRTEDHAGQIWLESSEPVTRPVISNQLAYLVTHVLSDESARWSSMGHPNPLEIGRPSVAKIGKTETNTHTWTIGYTPEIAVGVWVGLPRNSSEIGSLPTEKTLTPESSIPTKVAAGLWHAMMKYITLDMTPTPWEIPPGLSRINVCDPSGMLPSRNCPTTVTEIFLPGNEPTQPDILYQEYQINRETGRLATVFTPPELIDERVYLIVPPEATEWAQATGIPTPPEVYDVIYTPPSSQNTVVNSPEMYSHINGKAEIIGNAYGELFSSYRLQVGKGLNPQSWLQISEDIEEPVEDGLLGSWDTEGLDGLFAIQLVVVREDLRVDTATIQVTVDNQPPVVKIPYPTEGQRFTYDISTPITFQAEASDNTELNDVSFYLGERLLARQTNPPFAVPWRGGPGEYTIQVIATDLAGNESEATVTFIVERE